MADTDINHCLVSALVHYTHGETLVVQYLDQRLIRYLGQRLIRYFEAYIIDCVSLSAAETKPKIFR